MTRNTPPIRPRSSVAGWMLIEAIVALGVMGTVVATWAMAESQAGRFNAVQLARQRCVAAGEAQLDSLTSMAQELPATEVARLWPGVQTQVTRSAGGGQWENLTLVRVRCDAVAGGRPVKIELSRYVRQR